MMTTQEQRCSGILGSPWFNTRCLRTTKLVERDGKWYCWQHDPEREAAWRAAWEEKWARETAERQRIEKRIQAEREAAALIVRLAKTARTEPYLGTHGLATMSLELLTEILALAARLETTGE